MKHVILFITWIAILGASVTALADEAGEVRPPAQPSQKLESDAQFDKRLPPVLPGEEVSDGKKVIKMWSTSGGVPVSQAPEPFAPCQADNQEGCNKIPSEVGVIVDQRRDRR